MHISADEVRSEIDRYWGAFQAKAADLIAEFYAHESAVFSTTAMRPEPGRLAAARRQREYFGPNACLRVLTSNVDVVIASDTVAVATYTFHMTATKVGSATAKTGEETIRNGRATQVFQLDPMDGRIRILHEHLSIPAGA